MPDIDGLCRRLVPAADIPTPAVGKVHVFGDIADGLVKYKNSAGTVHVFVGATGPQGIQRESRPAGAAGARGVAGAAGANGAATGPRDVPGGPGSVGPGVAAALPSGFSDAMNENRNSSQNTEPDKGLIGPMDRAMELPPIGSDYALRSGFLSSATDANETASLRQLFNNIWGGKWTILIIVSVITTAALFVLQLTNPLFSAEALVLVESREQNLIGIAPVVTSLDEQTQKVESEIELLQAPELALKVIEQLHLHRLKEFNASLRTMGIFNHAQELLNRWSAPFITAPKNDVLIGEQRIEKQRALMINEFLDRLRVVPAGRSRVISVSFKSEDPYLAARIVNTLIRTYISQQLAAKLEPIERANKWLTMRLSVLRDKVEAAETAVERLRQEFGLVHGQPGITLESQQISELNTQLIMARAQGAEAEARLRPVKSLVKLPGGFESSAEVLKSPLIQRLREQEARLAREAARLMEEHGRKHPKVINIQAAQKNLKSEVAAEVAKIAKGLENEVAVARGREASLQANVSALKQHVARSNESEVKLRALERDAGAQRVLLETFLRRLSETSVQKDTALQQADSRLISKAFLPSKPTYPHKTAILLMSFAGSVFTGIAFIFLRNLFNGCFYSGEEIESATGVPVLGLIPKFSRMGAYRIPPERYFKEYPSSTFGEAIRMINTAIRFSSKGDSSKRLLITSALPREGKTLIALSLAHTQVVAGHTVVLVSADVHSPTAEAAFNLPDGPGLGEYLAGQASIEQLIKKDKATGIDVVTAGRWEMTNVAKSFDIDRMDWLLHDLARKYEWIIIDSPPVLAASETRVLANKVNMTIFVVRWATTRRRAVRQALRQIARSGNPIGILLSIVDVRSHGLYGYANYDTTPELLAKR